MDSSKIKLDHKKYWKLVAKCIGVMLAELRFRLCSDLCIRLKHKNCNNSTWIWSLMWGTEINWRYQYPFEFGRHKPQTISMKPTTMNCFYDAIDLWWNNVHDSGTSNKSIVHQTLPVLTMSVDQKSCSNV